MVIKISVWINAINSYDSRCFVITDITPLCPDIRSFFGFRNRHRVSWLADRLQLLNEDCCMESVMFRGLCCMESVMFRGLCCMESVMFKGLCCMESVMFRGLCCMESVMFRGLCCMESVMFRGLCCMESVMFRGLCCMESVMFRVVIFPRRSCRISTQPGPKIVLFLIAKPNTDGTGTYVPKTNLLIVTELSNKKVSHSSAYKHERY
jgi:hypothetical protein